MKTKIRNWLDIRRVFALTVLVILIAASLSDFLSAQALSQGYSSDEQLQKGMIIQIKESDTTKVEKVSQETAEQMHGVVVDPNDAPITISADGQKVFVATAGQYQVLVNNQNGSIKAGEYITISSISGIGMKVDDKQPTVVGRALEDFDGQSDIISTAKVGEQDVSIGRVRADITVAGNPFQKPPVITLPSFLRKVAENVANKPVNTSRIYVSLAVILISAFVSGSLMYSGVRSAIISIGRNPLSKKSIVKGMIQVVIVGFTIFLAGLFGVYLLLRL